ncbi:MAG: diguanylate cyclase [Planctomycetota bacterium]
MSPSQFGGTTTTTIVPSNQIAALSGFQSPANECEEIALDSRVLIFAPGPRAKEIRDVLAENGFRQISYTSEFSVLNEIVRDASTDLLLVDFTDCEQNREEILVILEDFQEKQVAMVAILDRHDEFGKKLGKEAKADEFLFLPIDSDELICRVKGVINSQILVRKLEQYSAQLQTDILLDPLTQIANRRAFDFEMSRKMIEWQRQRNPLAVMMIDIDYFKKVNDVFGHQAGDFVLKATADIISKNIREMDLVCRFGGEEFSAIMPIKRPRQSLQSADRMRKAIEEAIFSFEGKDIEVTVSIGVAEAMRGDDRELILGRADAALYHAKRSGRNLVAYHDGSICKLLENCRNSRETSDRENSREECFSVWSAAHENNFNLFSTNILILGQDLDGSQKIRKVLAQSGFRNLIVEDETERLPEYFKVDPPELIMLDYGSSIDWGIEQLKTIRQCNLGRTIPAVVLDSVNDRASKDRLLELGGIELIQKPFTGNEINVRVRNTLLASSHARYLENYTAQLEHDVKNRTTELIASRREAIQCLARAAEIRDDISGHHILRVGKYAAQIAQELGFTDSQVIEMEHAAQLHDVGKLGLPDSILKKETKLTDEEFDLVKDHCHTGGMIIRDSSSEHSCEQTNLFLLESCSSSVMKMAALVAESHHEKWDGSGYPHGLCGHNIPIEGRIVAVCDVFDAISHSKPYRNAFKLEECFKMIQDGSGIHFDPEIVQAFFRRKDQILQIFHDFGNFDLGEESEEN